ncbi:MAG: hypothetical protein MR992_14685 [Lachnospiraceae bacterium]|nr:hypothetical protein [Lachnospiraceae bacterium]
MSDNELTTEEWRQKKKEQRARFTALQNLPYEVKIRRQARRAWQYYEEISSRDENCHVSVGGLDSITLYIWLKSIGINVPAISVSNVEDKSIQKVHKALGIENVKSYKSKAQVINEVGFPVISKKIAGRIELLQNPTEDNKTVRHAIITGECGEQGHFAKNSRMKLPKRWLELFGGPENENEGVNYKTAPFKVSNRCCYYLKEKPCDDWAKSHNSHPYIGMMASEGGQREESLIDHGCNYYGKTVIRSAPFAPFLRNDILTLAMEMNEWYLRHMDIFEELYYQQPYSRDKNGSRILYEPVESIIPAIYGEIKTDHAGNLRTTKAQRTGCSMCGFGIHLEERPHRFDRKRQENPKEWEYLMYHMVRDKESGEEYGWGRVLDYIGVAWEDIPPVQMSLFDLMEEEP